jgi:hypothetical protein
MWFGGRAKRSNKKLDENFGRNLNSFIIIYRKIARALHRVIEIYFSDTKYSR